MEFSILDLLGTLNVGRRQLRSFPFIHKLVQDRVKFNSKSRQRDRLRSDKCQLFLQQKQLRGPAASGGGSGLCCLVLDVCFPYSRRIKA